MCGIIGVWSLRNRAVGLSRDELVRMLVDSADRGQDSTGVTLVTPEGGITTCSTAGDVGEWLVEAEASGFLELVPLASVILGCTRAQPVPEGDSRDPVNRQPMVNSGWIGVHNGTIGNDRELREDYGLKVRSQVDTETAIALLDLFLKESLKTQDPLGNAMKRWVEALTGGLAMLLFNIKSRTMVGVKNFKPLCYAYVEERGVVYCASERKTLIRGGLYDIRWIPPYTAFINHPKNNFTIETKHESVLPEGDPQKALVVTSGGIDSSTAAFVAAKMHGKAVTLVHFDYGQIAREREWAAVLAIAEALGPAQCTTYQVDLRWYGALADTPLVSDKVELPLGIKSVETTGCWVPARNLVMLSVAAGIAEAEGHGCIYTGFNLEESGVYSDNDIEFLKIFNLALTYGTIRRPKLVLALERLMKPEIVKLGQHLRVPFDKTWSCDRGLELPCGECGCCWMRQYAFLKAGVSDRQRYEYPPREKPPWVDQEISAVAPIEDILSRVKARGLEDLISL